MPICEVCQLFYVRPQTFETLFNSNKRCIVCETYEKISLQQEIFPLDGNILEYYTFNQSEHPMFTKRIFETLLDWGHPAPIFYEASWLKYPRLLDIITPLLKPLRLFNYERAIHVLIALLDE